MVVIGAEIETVLVAVAEAAPVAATVMNCYYNFEV